MSATSRRPGAGWDPETQLLAVVLGVVVLGVGSITGALHLANAISDHPQVLPGNPVVLVVALAKGKLVWPTVATVILIVAGVVILMLAALVFALVLRKAGKATRVDRAGRYMGRGRDIEALTSGAAATAKRLGVDALGLPIAASVIGNQILRMSWEDVSVDIWGPRTGKSTSRAIPAILAAPGAVLATSNKRDLVDATRDIRGRDAKVWVFDPQNLVGEAPTWYWDYTSYVTDETKAAILADVFADASRAPGARTDAYFDPAGRELVANLLLASALDKHIITQTYLWLTDPTDDTAVEILQRRGYPLNAASLKEVIALPEKQRSGVYGTGKQLMGFLTNRQTIKWVTPGDDRTPFDTAAFAHSKQTLYSLSKEGRGSAGPLVTALTVAVTEAAEEYAKQCPGGRLPVPMVAVLDEAANVCRWQELPNLYSHYGSRGICMLTILQSWSQGVEVWGINGMRKLWSAANVKVYGGGVSETEFLGEVSRLIGRVRLPKTSRSQSRNGRSTNYDTETDDILDVADLGALPKGRAVVLASGSRPTLSRTLPWMTGPFAEQIKESIRAHDPAAEKTITQAMKSLSEVQEQEASSDNPWVSAA